MSVNNFNFMLDRLFYSCYIGLVYIEVTKKMTPELKTLTPELKTLFTQLLTDMGWMFAAFVFLVVIAAIFGFSVGRRLG